MSWKATNNMDVLGEQADKVTNLLGKKADFNQLALAERVNLVDALNYLRNHEQISSEIADEVNSPYSTTF